MFQVEKRDGTIAEFQMKKITDAIGKAFGAKDMQFSDDMLQMLALRVTADFQSKIKDGKISVEAIQDSVENVLIQCGYAEVAKAYILYRKQREKIRNMKSTIVDYKEIVDSYVKVEDWRVKENSTVTYSVGGLILSNSGAITANYWLSEIYDDEIAEAHRNADIHIHDLSMLTGYCAGWSLKQLIKEGLGGINGKITSSPARHLSVLCNQMVNFLGIMQNEWAGAQAFSSFDTASTHRAAGEARHRSPTSHSTGPYRMTSRSFRRSSAVRRWTSSTKTVKKRWIWSTKRSSRR